MTDLNDFNRLSDGEIPFIDFKFVDRAICEDPANGFFQLIPYVSFSSMDVAEGRLSFVMYRRPSKGEGEERLQGNASFGFGGHIDSENDLVFSEKVVNEEGDTVYKMSLEDIKQTCMTCAKREMTEEVGFDPFEELEVSADNIMFGLEREQEPDEVGQVHVCISMKVNLDKPRYNSFFEKTKANEKEVEELKTISVDVARFLGSFNVQTATEQMTKQLTDELKMEKWSILVVTSMLTQLVEFVQKGWNFESVMNDIFMRAQQEQLQAQQEPVDVQENDPVQTEDVQTQAQL